MSSQDVECSEAALADRYALGAARAGDDAGGSAEGLRDRSERGLRILVADDNCDSAETLTHLLCARGHAAEHVCNGEDAIAAALARRPQVVLLDIGMPDISGYEVARRLRAEPGLQHTALIALTGYDADEDRLCALEAGFSGHLVKPIDLVALDRLLGAVGEAAQGAQAAGNASTAAGDAQA